MGELKRVRGVWSPVRRLRGAAALFVGLSVVAACGGSSAQSGPPLPVRSSAPYASEALEAVKTVAAFQVEAIEEMGRPLTYRETHTLVDPLGLEVIAGGSRDPHIVSVQLEHVYPPGVVPIAAEDGKDCIMAVITFPHPNGRSVDGIEFSWILIKEYFRRPDVVPSAVCAAEAFAGMLLDEFEPSPDPAFPVIFD